MSETSDKVFKRDQQCYIASWRAATKALFQLERACEVAEHHIREFVKARAAALEAFHPRGSE